MIKDVKLANRVILGVAVALGIAGIVIAAVDSVSHSESVLLDLARQILFILFIFVLFFVRSVINRDSLTKYISLVAIAVLLVLLVVFVAERVL